MRQIRCWRWVLNLRSVRLLREWTCRPGSRQTMFFSATFPSVIRRLASDFLSTYIFLTVGRVGSSTDLIAQKVDYVLEVDKRSHLMQILHAQLANEICGKLALTLVFVEAKKGADLLEYGLSVNGFPAIAIHGDKVQMDMKKWTCRQIWSCNCLLLQQESSTRRNPIRKLLLGSSSMLRDQLVLARANVTGQAGLVGMTTEMLNPGERITTFQATIKVQILLLMLLLVPLMVLLMLVLLLEVNVMLLQTQIHMLFVDMEKAMNQQLPLAGIRALLRSLSFALTYV